VLARLEFNSELQSSENRRSVDGGAWVVATIGLP
jgi:hypothetical protein